MLKWGIFGQGEILRYELFYNIAAFKAVLNNSLLTVYGARYTV